ncbi:MAG: glycosyltransferase family 2 protein [Microbacterium sp.]|uniref:glycosyltransferase family 2 protein n=1 Tax=Microbacterium sp. TaxID=51671 RepID=UPI003F7EC2DA
MLLPVRDGEATVRHAVASTLRAMPRDAELVIWDDASTDRTVAVIENFSDRRVRLIRSDRAVGVGAALRALCDRTDSRFVARMDADDVCLPWRFAAQSAGLRDGRRGILFSPVLRFRTAPLRVLPSAPVAVSAQALPLHLAVMCVVMHPTMFATRRAVETAGGYRDVSAEDYDLWLRAATAGVPMARSSLPTLAYRRHVAQVSSTAEYARRVSGDGLLAQSYRDFARATLDLDVDWMPGLSAALPDAARGVRELRARLEERSAGLTAWQRHLLQRTMRRLPA